MPAELGGDERLVREWLCERGYEPEYEPKAVVGGKKPDFLAIADGRTATPNVLWAEVKSLERDDTDIAMSRSWPILKELGVPDNLHGHAMLHVTEATREQSVR